MPSQTMNVNNKIEELELEKYALELDLNELTIIPPSVTDVTESMIKQCTTVLFKRFK